MRLLERIKNAVDSRQPTRFVARSVRNLFFPARRFGGRAISIEATSICNAKCTFCNYRFGFRKKLIMPPALFESVATSAVKLGYENLDLTSPGGELFVIKNVVTLIEVAKKAGFRHIGTYTNGMLLYRHDMERLLLSGIDALLISFPGFERHLFKEIYQVDKYDQFRKSISQLLEAHRRLGSNVFIVFEPRTYQSLREIEKSEFYKQVVGRYLNDRIKMTQPLRVFDTWADTIKKEDLNPGMKMDVMPLKSIYPLKNPYLCTRLYILGVCANGDVRLCNCIHDAAIESEQHDGLYIDNLHQHQGLEGLMAANKAKIDQIRSSFRAGKIPHPCRSCALYLPADYPVGANT